MVFYIVLIFQIMNLVMAESSHQLDTSIVSSSLAVVRYKNCNTDVYCKLRNFLDYVRYHNAVVTLANPEVNSKNPPHLKVVPAVISFKGLRDGDLLNVFTEQVNAVHFFYFGKEIDISKKVFESNFIKLPEELVAAGLATKNGNMVKMKYSITPIRFSNLMMYIMHTSIAEKEDDATIDGSSFTTLSFLKDNNYANLSELDRANTLVDFGSGTGVLTIAMLLAHPNIKHAIGLEIVNKAIELSKNNAKLNDVSSRFHVFNNSNVDALSGFLRSSSLTVDYAISNPPWNIVPDCATAQGVTFDKFGGGGADGLKVTRIFVKQLIGLKQHSLLSSNFKFVFYSLLAEDTSGNFLIEKDIANNFKSNYLRLNNTSGWECSSAEDFADLFVSFLNQDIVIKPASFNDQTFKTCLKKEWTSKGIKGVNTAWCTFSL